MRNGMRFFQIATFIAVICAVSAGLQTITASNAQNVILRMDPRLDQIVPKNAVLEKVVDGFTWVEGPVWNLKGRFLLFS